MSITHNPNTLSDGLALLLTTFQQPNIINMLSVLLGPIQDLEDTFYDLAVERRLDTAIGAQLDVYGIIVGASRRGLSDDDYRVYLQVRIQANRSNGQGDVILAVVQNITQGLNLLMQQHPPAAYHLQWNSSAGTSSALQFLLERLLNETTAAGVEWTAVEGTADAARFDVDVFDTGVFGDRFHMSS